MSQGYLRALQSMTTWAYKSPNMVVERLNKIAGFTDDAVGDREVWKAEVGALEQAHLFEFPEHVGTLLTLTDNEPHPIKLPFPVCFLDVEFSVRTRNVVNNYIGILLCQKEGEDQATAYAYCDAHAEVTWKEGENVDDAAVETKRQLEEKSIIIDVRYPIGPISFDSLKERMNIGDPGSSMAYARAEFKTLNNITLNFLDLLETPDVFLVQIKKNRANERRMRHGQKPLPERTVVKVRDSIRRYIYNLEAGGAFYYSHRFWVRGHFMHFRSDRYMASGLQGEKQWILPHTKGEGILIKKPYEMPGMEAQ